MWRQNNKKKFISSIELTLDNAKNQLDQIEPKQVMVIESSKRHMIFISKEKKDSFSFYDPNGIEPPKDSFKEKELLKAIQSSLDAKPGDLLTYTTLIQTTLKDAVWVKLSLNTDTALAQATGGPKLKS